MSSNVTKSKASDKGNLIPVAPELFLPQLPQLPEYIALFLSDVSRDRLLSWWQNTIQVPLLSEVLADHITLVYDPTPEERPDFESLVGSQGFAKVIGWAANDKAQAVWVRCVPKSKNTHAHVTLATHDTPAVYSNELLWRSTLIDGPYLDGFVDIRRD